MHIDVRLVKHDCTWHRILEPKPDLGFVKGLEIAEGIPVSVKEEAEAVCEYLCEEGCQVDVAGLTVEIEPDYCCYGTGGSVGAEAAMGIASAMNRSVGLEVRRGTRPVVPGQAEKKRCAKE